MLDAHRVAPKLWVGGYPGSAAKHLGHFGVVALCACELQSLQAPVWVVKAPLDDGPPPDRQEIERALGAAGLLANMTLRGERALSTCAQGVNRSALVAAMVLMMRGQSAPGAIAAIRSGRRPPNGMMPLSNQHFVGVLQRLDRDRRHLSDAFRAADAVLRGGSAGPRPRAAAIRSDTPR